MRATKPLGSTPTARELQTLAVVLASNTTKDAAFRLGITVQSTKNNLTSLYERLGVANRLGAAFHLGWLQIPEEVLGGLDPTSDVRIKVPPPPIIRRAWRPTVQTRVVSIR